MVTIKMNTFIQANIDTCFDLACDLDLHRQTVWKWTRETVLGRGGKISMGDTVTFRATHFFIRQTFTSKIIEYERPARLVDQMTKGAFKSFIHIHEFKEAARGTFMTDTLSFEAPYGIIGKFAEQLILKHYMKLFILHRGKQIKKIAESGFII